MDDKTSKLLVKTFDGSLVALRLKPRCMDSTVELDIRYYDHDGEGPLVKARAVFRGVVSIDLEVNLFDNYIGAELCGFYEILQTEKKKEIVERIFRNRLDGFLYHGDYDYDADDGHDMLNWREPVDKLYQDLDKYHLYQQQTQGGIYHILAKSFALIVK